MRYISAEYIADELVSQFSIEMDIWDVVRLSAKALKRVGAFGLQRKVWYTAVNNFQVVLPPDAYKARGALRISPHQSYSNPIIVSDKIEQPPQTFFVELVEEIFSNEPILLKTNYVPKLLGTFVNYEYDHPVLRFNETDFDTVIEYTGLKVDENGMPMIPEDASDACLFYCLFSRIQSDYLLKKVDRGMLSEVKEWKNNAIRQAKASLTMTSLTSNEMDKVLNIMTSMDRKAFNVPS